ncbi:MAG: hypothetical protein ABIH66_03400 [bacterium]
MDKPKLKILIAVMASLALACGSFLLAADEQAEKEKVEEEFFNRAVETAFAHREKAQIYYKKNKKDKTLEELMKIIEIDFPEKLKGREEYEVVYYAYVNAGKLLLEMEKPDKARVLVAEGVKKAPELSVWTYELYRTQGKIFTALDMEEEALKSIDKAMEITKKLEKAQKKKAAVQAQQAAAAETGESKEEDKEKKENDKDE